MQLFAGKVAKVRNISWISAFKMHIQLILIFSSSGFSPGLRSSRSRVHQFAGSQLTSVVLFCPCHSSERIQLGKAYRLTGAFEVDNHEDKVAELLPNCVGRTTKGLCPAVVVQLYNVDNVGCTYIVVAYITVYA